MRDASEQFRSELGRFNYVTPTSYLELISMFARLLNAKRAENSLTLSRYTVGLDKLQSSAAQVATMQQELRVSSHVNRAVHGASMSALTTCHCTWLCMS